MRSVANCADSSVHVPNSNLNPHICEFPVFFLRICANKPFLRFSGLFLTILTNLGLFSDNRRKKKDCQFINLKVRLNLIKMGEKA